MVSPKQSTFHAENVWKTLVRASVDRRHPWRVTNFCTLNEQGPQARCIILREVNLQECELLFYTDARSQKVSDLQHNHSVSLLFWNHSSQEQLRAWGTASIYSDSPIVERHFSKLGAHALKDYASLSAPGTPRGTDVAVLEPDSEMARHNFRLIRVEIHKMDYLKLSREGHQRFEMLRNGQSGESGELFWAVQELIP